MSTNDTKDRIISAAEQLFAERGFGTKDALLQAVFDRRIRPVNQQRLERLDQLEREAGAAAPRLEDILEAFLSPIMDLKRDLEGEGMVWSRFIGRVYSEPLEIVETLIRDHFEEVGHRFVAALVVALPELSETEIAERLLFSVGALSHTLIDLHQVLAPREGSPPIGAPTLQHLVVFLAAAFRAPSVDVAHGRGGQPVPEAAAS